MNEKVSTVCRTTAPIGTNSSGRINKLINTIATQASSKSERQQDHEIIQIKKEIETMVREFPVQDMRKPVCGGARGPGVSSAASHFGNREKRLRKVTPNYITRESRQNPRIQQGKNCSFQNSIVFLKKKAAQAVLIQANVRGFLARKALPNRKAVYKLEQEQNRETARRINSATTLQAFVRGTVYRHRYILLLRRHEAVTTIQAVMRGKLQRMRWLTSHKITLRFLQIKRDETTQLEQITRDKLAAMESLDQKLEDFHEEQKEITRQECLLDQKTQAQGSLKDQLRRENRQMRHKMDKLLQKRKEIKMQSRSLDHTIEVAAKVRPELEKTICQLESSIQKRQTALKKLDEIEKRLNEKIDNLQDKVDSETHQKESYHKSITQLLQRLTERCPNDRVLIAHCTALANNDNVALKVVELQSRINESYSNTKADIRSIHQWKRKQMKLAYDQVGKEFEAADSGQRLQRRHTQEHQAWLERRMRYCQRNTKQLKARLNVAKAENESLKKKQAALRSATKFLQQEFGKLQIQDKSSKKQLRLACQACQKQRRHLERAKACEAREVRRQAILRRGIQGITVAIQGSSANTNAMDPHLSDILSSVAGI